jgi:hypothetical protein
MFNIDLDKAGKDAVDEVATKIVPLLEPILQDAVYQLIDALKDCRVVITIEHKT